MDEISAPGVMGVRDEVVVTGGRRQLVAGGLVIIGMVGGGEEGGRGMVYSERGGAN